MLTVPGTGAGTVCVPWQVKAKIHSHISRQLECLRSREVWLFEQVDLIQQLKEEALQQQAQQLYWVSLAWHSLHWYFQANIILASVGSVLKLEAETVTCVLSSVQYLGQFNCLIHQLERSYSNELANQISLCLER